MVCNGMSWYANKCMHACMHVYIYNYTHMYVIGYKQNCIAPVLTLPKKNGWFYTQHDESGGSIAPRSMPCLGLLFSHCWVYCVSRQVLGRRSAAMGLALMDLDITPATPKTSEMTYSGHTDTLTDLLKSLANPC